ncbi:MAG: phenylalanine--tRNA ligase subunit beta [Thermoproteota archaeon]|nr:phenylalanine--tRNA ligase subunit beta [Thermoproteota archaeon]
MPVVDVRLTALSDSFPNINLKEIIERIPYIGLDIEGVDENNGTIRVEFNPNRPDYSSENGIMRALNGLFEKEVGLPIVKDIEESDYVICVDETVGNIRPVICAFVAKRKEPLDGYEISQLISMQEDLHNGVGRKRKKSSIGMHNLDDIVFPLKYTTVPKHFSFIPLDKENEFTIESILKNLDVGKKYGHVLNDPDIFPILSDSQKNVLSFPPIINGNLTKIKSNTNNLLIEVTSINEKSAHDILSILSFELYDMGFKIYSIRINSNSGESVKTPILKHSTMIVSDGYVNKILGLNLSNEELIKCLERSRCSGKVLENGDIECSFPRYRIDIFNPVDISEEVAIGYGIYRFDTTSPTYPQYPSLYFSGKKHVNSVIFNSIRDVLIGLGFVEIINSSIISKGAIDDFFIKSDGEDLVSIKDSKSSEFEILRNSIIPSIMVTLSKNIHEKYPQKLFEIGKTFKVRHSELKEEWSLGVAIAHNNTNYSEIKSVLESLIKYCFNKNIKTPRCNFEYYLNGHSAKILFSESEIGDIGEIYPQVIENFKLRTLVSVFQINLNSLMDLLDLKKINYL